MSPVPGDTHRLSPTLPSKATPIPEISTWQTITPMRTTQYMSGIIYPATQIWTWLQRKAIEPSIQKSPKTLPKRLTPRSSPIKKRWAPFNATVNVVEWTSRIIKWIYHQADAIPGRIQRHVDREYWDIQEQSWETKNEEADEKVKEIFVKEFPELYKKLYLEPYEEGSELFEKNLRRLEMMGDKVKRGAQRRSWEVHQEENYEE